MSNETAEKHFKIKRSTLFLIVVGALGAAFLTLSAVTSAYSVKQAKTSIAAIGKVTYSVESKEKIDTAIEGYESLDRNIGLSTTFAPAVNGKVQYETLENAKKEYVRLAIKTAIVADQRKIADELTVEEIAEKVVNARKAVDEYFKDITSEVETYEELVALEKKYSVEKQEEEKPSTDGPTTGGDEEIEIC